MAWLQPSFSIFVRWLLSLAEDNARHHQTHQEEKQSFYHDAAPSRGKLADAERGRDFLHCAETGCVLTSLNRPQMFSTSSLAAGRHNRKNQLDR